MANAPRPACVSRLLTSSPGLNVPLRMRPYASKLLQSFLGNSLAMCSTSGPAHDQTHTGSDHKPQQQQQQQQTVWDSTIGRLPTVLTKVCSRQYMLWHRGGMGETALFSACCNLTPHTLTLSLLPCRPPRPMHSSDPLPPTHTLSRAAVHELDDEAVCVLWSCVQPPHVHNNLAA
jgi:hypothetical protein